MSSSPKVRNPQSYNPKTGFYARLYRSGELADLDAMLAEGLQEEITLLRVATRRVIETIAEFETPKEAVATLGALGLAATRLASLLRTQKLLDSGTQNTSAALSQALSDVIKELDLHV